MSIIPVLGFLWYGWSVEKIQFIRGDQLYIAERNRVRMEYISHDLRAGMQPTVVERLDGQTNYTYHLLHDRGRYLAGERITPLPGRGGLAPSGDSSRDPDKPYISLLDEFYLITAGEYNSYSIERLSGDTSWAFVSHLPDSICLVQSVRGDGGMGVGGTTDTLQQDFQVSSKLEGSLFSSYGIDPFHGVLLGLVVLVFLWGLPRLLDLTVKRLFLLDFIKLPDAAGGILGRYFDAKDLPIPDFAGDANGLLPPEEQEEYILRTMLDHQQAYELIWAGLSGAERYFLYDFARDGYTNYKDSVMLIVLLQKGLLRCWDDQWSLFALSFREFVRRKKGTEEIATLKKEFAVPGVWATIRMPTLIVITACAVLLFMTQESVSHKITVAITSVGAIVPIIMEITKRLGSKGAG